MNNRKHTVTIGIPAHNEAENIGNLLRSVLKQCQKLFTIEQILVVCDGCTDNTEDIVKKFAKKHKEIKVINDKKRLGKTSRLNQILKMNKSNFLFFLDADMLLERQIELENMVNDFTHDKKINVIAGFQVPVKANTFIGKINNAAFQLWYDTTTSVNYGNHIFNLHGSISGLRKSFAKSLVFPSELTCDQGYLYMKAVEKNRNGFKLSKNTRFLFRTVGTLNDSQLQGTRSIFKDKEHMRKYFGEEVMKKEYAIPKKNKIINLCKFLLKNPIFTILAIGLGIYIRTFTKKDMLNNSGIWETVKSSKESINYQLIKL